MEPIYLDLHIHTSENPNILTDIYDIDSLLEKMRDFSKSSNFLISFTDHNTINKKAYLLAKERCINTIIGSELHIRYSAERTPFHCHIYFKTEKELGNIIDDLNKKLDKLYPKKVIDEKKDIIPSLQDILNEFNEFDFILLPHAGQSHSSFNLSIPPNSKLDNIIEKSIYYNFFDGFTARSNKGLEETDEYFKKIGIRDFVNLVTCSDNYSPKNYPNPKAKNADPFIPTWMLAQPTFDGLRLSLSESSRLTYSLEKPTSWSVYIKSAHLDNDKINIDVKLTPGLNVIIGGSSSGKTLFVQSLYDKINNDFSKNEYKDYGVSDIVIDNPQNMTPYYISQSFISDVVNNKNYTKNIEDIPIIKKIFPDDKLISEEIDSKLKKFRQNFKALINCVEVIEETKNNLNKICSIYSLVIKNIAKENILEKLIPLDSTIETFDIRKSKHREFIEHLDEISRFLSMNLLLTHNPKLANGLKKELDKAFIYSRFEKEIRKIIETKKETIDDYLKSEDIESQTKKLDFERLLKNIKKYVRNYIDFYKMLEIILEDSFEYKTPEKIVMGHKLLIKNNFALNKDEFLEKINYYLKPDSKIDVFKEISPERLFKHHFKDNPLITSYEEFEISVYVEFEKLREKKYEIISKDGREYSKLSAGWKSSILLDLALGYEEDVAPLIIDQPEDNLASEYINKNLVDTIKKIKSKKQIILVSHNATIPMIGDAQNVILCRNEANKISIKSSQLEGGIDGKSTVDWIAKITDGGKNSIKKRIKKYNLKQFKE